MPYGDSNSKYGQQNTGVIMIALYHILKVARNHFRFYFPMVLLCGFMAHGYQSTPIYLPKVPGKEFHLVKNKENIKVYHTRSPKKGHVEYKASTLLKEVHLDEVMNFFVDYNDHPLWVFNCLESKVEKLNDHSYLYQVCKSPWPMKNRDLSVRIETRQLDKNTIMVNFISAPNIMAHDAKNVRITEFFSSWAIEQKKNDVLITVYAEFDPKLATGNLMLKSYTTKIPFETLKGFKDQYHVKM